MEDVFMARALADLRRAERAERARHGRLAQRAPAPRPHPSLAMSAWYAPRWRALLARVAPRHGPSSADASL